MIAGRARRPGPPTEDKADETGFTLLELTLAAAILAVFLALVVPLLLESQRLFVHVAREHLDAAPDFALALLRYDVRHGQSSIGSTTAWSTAPLYLQARDGRRLWALDDQYACLARAVFDDRGETPGPRCIVRNVRRFQWRTPSARLVEIELTVERRTAGPGWQAVRDPRFDDGRVLQTHRVLVALRDGNRGSTW